MIKKMMLERKVSQSHQHQWDLFGNGRRQDKTETCREAPGEAEQIIGRREE